MNIITKKLAVFEYKAQAGEPECLNGIQIAFSDAAQPEGYTRISEWQDVVFKTRNENELNHEIEAAKLNEIAKVKAQYEKLIGIPFC